MYNIMYMYVDPILPFMQNDFTNVNYFFVCSMFICLYTNPSKFHDETKPALPCSKQTE